MKKYLMPILFVTLLVLPSCSTYFDLTEAQTSYYQGDYDRALNFLLLNTLQIEKAQGSIVYSLDEGIVSHAADKYKVSNISLARAERAIEDNFTKSISASIGSFFLNESVRDYESSFYEDIYSNIFLSLNYYHLNEVEDAMVEVRRSLEKLQLREQNLPQLRASLEKQLADNNVSDIDNKLTAFNSDFYSSALSYYLSSLFAFEYGDYDTFRISRDKAQATYKILPTYYQEKKYDAFDTLESVKKDSTVINFLAFSGLAPIKITKVDRNVLVLDEYVDENGVYHKPYYTNVIYSVPQERGTNVKKIEVLIDGKKYYLQAFENLGKIAYEALQQTCSGEYVRAYIRAISREIAKSVADSSAVQEGQTYAQSSIFSDVFTLFSYAAEGSGDLRCSHFFPSMSWIGSFEIDPGKYNIQVKYLNSRNEVIYQEEIKDFKVAKSKANLVEILSAK